MSYMIGYSNEFHLPFDRPWMDECTVYNRYTMLWCKPNSRNFIVASVYRPPDASSAFFYAFEKMIGLIDDENKELHILGDLNCDMLKSVSDQPTKTLKV